MGWLDDAKSTVTEQVNKALIKTAAKAEDVRGSAIDCSLGEWRAKNLAAAAACAAGNLLPGPAALAALAVEIPALMHVLSRAAIGTGFVVRGHAETSDYPLILAHWAGALELNGDFRRAVQVQLSGALAGAAGSTVGLATAKAVAGAAGAKLAAKAGVKLNTMVLSSAMLAVAGKAGATQVGTTLAAGAIATKIVSSIPTRIIPFVGAGIAAAINGWLVNGMVTSAAEYYGFIDSVEAELAPA